MLRAQPDNSVTIAAIGFPMNIRNLLRNYPDLFKQKVKEVYYMNGGYNFGCAQGFLGNANDCYGAAQEVQVKFPHNVREYYQINGGDMCTGGDFYNNRCSDDSNPIYRAYRDWMNHTQTDCHPARPSWDPLTVLAAILGPEGAHLDKGQEGTDEIDEQGNENFVTNWKNNEYWLNYNGGDARDKARDMINKAMCAGSNASREAQFLQ